MPSQPESPRRHAPYEDATALLLGTAFAACSIVLYSHSTLTTGGTTGLGLLLQYATGWGFWVTFSLINLPFYALAILRMGWAFTLRTAIAVSLVAGFSAFFPKWMDIGKVDPVFAAIFASALMGNALLILFRHRTALGGVNILALFLNERLGWKIPLIQLSIDAVTLGLSLFYIPAWNVFLSLLGCAVVNLVLWLNHKPERYTGTT